MDQRRKAQSILVALLMITITVNGSNLRTNHANLLAALREWRYIDEKSTVEQSAVAINGEFIPRTQYNEVQLHNGDEVEIVGAVGGG